MMQQLQEIYLDIRTTVASSLAVWLPVVNTTEEELCTELTNEQVHRWSIIATWSPVFGCLMTEIQCLGLPLTMPVCVDVSNSTQELTGVNCDINKQHEDSS